MPDLELFADPALVRTRTGLNIRQMEILTQPDRPERQRVLELGLTDRAFRAKLTRLRRSAGLDDPREWTRRIVIDRANWPLSFHRWPLRDRQERGGRPHHRRATFPCRRQATSPSTPSHPLLRNLAGQPFLVAGQQGPNQLPVSFEARPDPRRIPGLARFTAQIVSEDSGPTGVVASVKPSADGPERAQGHLPEAAAVPAWNQGWHFVRVLPSRRRGDCPARRAVRHRVRTRTTRASASSSSSPADDDDDLTTCRHRNGRRSMPGVTQALRALSSGRWQDGRDWRAVQCHAVGWKGTAGTGRACARRSARMGPPTSRSPRCSRTSSGETLADPGRAVRWRLRVDAAESRPDPFRRTRLTCLPRPPGQSTRSSRRARQRCAPSAVTRPGRRGHATCRCCDPRLRRTRRRTASCSPGSFSRPSASDETQRASGARGP